MIGVRQVDGGASTAVFGKRRPAAVRQRAGAATSPNPVNTVTGSGPGIPENPRAERGEVAAPCSPLIGTVAHPSATSRRARIALPNGSTDVQATTIVAITAGRRDEDEHSCTASIRDVDPEYRRGAGCGRPETLRHRTTVLGHM